MTRYLLQRKVTTVLADRWEGPEPFDIPLERSLHGIRMQVQPGDYIVMRTANDWYPLAAAVAAEDYTVVQSSGHNDA